MLLSLRLHASIALISFTFVTSATHAEKLRITGTPPGAKVEINGVAFAPSASDLLDVLHPFYPVAAPTWSPASASRSSVSKTQEMSAGRDIPPGKSTTVVLRGMVGFKELQAWKSMSTEISSAT